MENAENFNLHICVYMCGPRKKTPSSTSRQYKNIYIYYVIETNNERKKNCECFCCLPKETEINLNNKHVS